MLIVAAMAALSLWVSWLPYRAWRKGVITILLTTSERSKEPKRFASDLVYASAFAVLCWIGTGICLYRWLYP